MRLFCVCLLGAVATCVVPSPSFGQASASRIDRRALVTRHNPTLTRIDPASPLMVGNGNLGFTADITGLQTFQEQYSPRVPLMIQAQWAWHSFPNPTGFSLAQAEQPVDVRGQSRPYPYLRDWDEARQPHIQWLRENPHRISLGRLALHLAKADGSRAAFADLSETRQTLDLWTGRLESRFVFDGAPVEVETSVHPTLDAVIVRLRSPLARLGPPRRRSVVSRRRPPAQSESGRLDAPRGAPDGRPARATRAACRSSGSIDDMRYAVTAAVGPAPSSGRERARTPSASPPAAATP